MTEPQTRPLHEIRLRRDILEKAQRLGTFTADIVADYDALFGMVESQERVVARLVKWGTDPDLPDGSNPPITPEGFDVLRDIIREAAALESESSRG